MNGKQKTVSNTIRRRVVCFIVLLIVSALVVVNVQASGMFDLDMTYTTYTTANMSWTEPTNPTTLPPTTVNTGKIYALLGDVNWDGKILADDARFTLRISARLETLYPWALAVADVNGDGSVLSDDARQILRYSAKLQNGFERVVPVQIPVALTTALPTSTAVPTTAAPTTITPSITPTTAAPTTIAPTTKAPDPTTAKSLSTVQTAWKNIVSANGYVSSDEMINALGGFNNAYQTGSARGCTNKIIPGSAYIYGDSASTSIQIITAYNPEEIIYEVALKDNTYSTPEGLSVGDSILSAKQLYGTPDREAIDLLIYNQAKPYRMMISYNSNGIITGISLCAKDD